MIKKPSSKVFIIHGWADDPDKGWMGWLRTELEAKNVQVIAPKLPNPRHPNVVEQLNALKQLTNNIDENTVLVGHSLGSALLLRLLSEPPFGKPIKGVVLVAGMIDSRRDYTPNYPSIHLANIKRYTQRRIAIYSDDDEWVEPERTYEMAKAIDAELRLDSGKGHFQGLKGCIELPSVLEAVQDCFS